MTPDLVVGSTPVALRRFGSTAHATVALVDDLLLAGDTLEDPVTGSTSPERLAIHLAELDRLAGLDFAHPAGAWRGGSSSRPGLWSGLSPPPGAMAQGL